LLQEKYELRRRNFDRSVAVPFASIETTNFVSQTITISGASMNRFMTKATSQYSTEWAVTL
jgi:hypothetical protein